MKVKKFLMSIFESIGAGLATIALAGVGAGIGVLFAGYCISYSYSINIFICYLFVFLVFFFLMLDGYLLISIFYLSVILTFAPGFSWGVVILDITPELNDVLSTTENCRDLYRMYDTAEYDLEVLLQKFSILNKLSKIDNNLLAIFEEAKSLDKLAFKGNQYTETAKSLQLHIYTKINKLYDESMKIDDFEQHSDIIKKTQQDIRDTILTLEYLNDTTLIEVSDQKRAILRELKELLNFNPREKNDNYVKEVYNPNLLRDDEGYFLRGEDDIYEEIWVDNEMGRAVKITRRRVPEGFLETIVKLFCYIIMSLFL
jgi:hypothetical protein